MTDQKKSENSWVLKVCGALFSLTLLPVYFRHLGFSEFSTWRWILHFLAYLNSVLTLGCWALFSFPSSLCSLETHLICFSSHWGHVLHCPFSSIWKLFFVIYLSSSIAVLRQESQSVTCYIMVGNDYLYIESHWYSKILLISLYARPLVEVSLMLTKSLIFKTFLI